MLLSGIDAQLGSKNGEILVLSFFSFFIWNTFIRDVPPWSNILFLGSTVYMRNARQMLNFSPYLQCSE